MADSAVISQPEFKAAFLANERQERIKSGKVACVLVVLLMPFGALLDYFTEQPDLGFFFLLRIVCSILVGLVWLLYGTPFGERHYKSLGLPIALLPAFFMTWMIYATTGPASPYYAGLNLVLLAISVVVHWSVWESLLAVGGVLLMYFAACLMKASHGDLPIIFNNFYFLVLTGVIVVTGNYFFSRLQFEQFALRYQLDQSKRMLEESNEKLVELDQIKSRFFANISHELRTPLTLLIAPLENLMSRFGRSLDPDTQETLRTMHSNGMRLLKLINDLLDLVRLESGRMEVKQEPLEVVEFIKGLASAARQVAEDKRIQLVTHVDPQLGNVLADRDKLEKILLNLTFNALKFTPAGGRVELRSERIGEDYTLVVADTGMGISEKNLAHIFDRFWQADGSSKRKYQGVGIGLALVKELVEIQGGTVQVQSQEGKGTTFNVRLPYRPAEPTPAPALVPVAAPVEGDAAAPTVSSEEWLANLYRRAELFPSLTSVQDSMRPIETSLNGSLPTLLIADDEPDMLRFLKSQLSTHYRVVEAVDGQQAVDKAGQFLPDIILLDMMMPEKDGLQACKEIREKTSTHSIPIVLLTARADEETKLAALQAGASDFLAKPFSTTELHVRIKNLVESHEYQRKVSKQKSALESTLDQLKDTETQLVQSEKLASLGRMSAGIIHEINNPLNFATTGVYALKSKAKYLVAEQQEEYVDILKDVEEGISRVKNIVTDLRMFSHPETESREPVAVAEVVGSGLRFLSGEWREKIKIEQNLPDDQTIWANKNRLIHVVLNLLQNSLHALRSKQFVDETPTVWIEGQVEKGFSRLIIRDNGPGIKDQDKDKIFDPFFTTKDVGEGMGLGLSICYRIVQDYEGRISVRTEAGKFCEFTLEFPVKG